MIKLLVDSSSDFSQEEIKKKNMAYVPVSIHLEDKDYLDGIDLRIDDFYELLLTASDFPKTSQPSPQDFLDHFEAAKKNRDQVICLLLSSALSGTCQSAYLAREMADYNGIYIVDTLNATASIRLLAEVAFRMMAEGESAPAIVDALEVLKKRVRILASVDTLEYLWRGGRLGRTGAVIGELANIKPVITVTAEGKVSLISKCIGKNKALSYLIRYVKEHTPDPAFPLYTVYSYGAENCEALEARLAKEGQTFMKRCQIGPTIGAHVGPGACGICYVESVAQ